MDHDGKASVTAGPRLLCAATGNDWVECDATARAQDTPNDASTSGRQVLERLLTELLLSDNLVVLAGLGTTLYLNRPGQPRVAPEMADLWTAATATAGDRFERLKTRVRYPAHAAEHDIEALLSQCLLAQALEPDQEVAAFIAAAEAAIVEKCRFVDESTELTTHETFLRKVARRSTRKPRVKLFTTNYDLCFETAASHTRFTVVDGFSHTHPQEFDSSFFAYDLVRREQDHLPPDYVPNVFHLYKLHGSLDWELRSNQVVKSTRPSKPLIIYPRNSKFEASYDPPFIDLMARFQATLRQPNTGLLVIGFGFRDPHVWQPIMAGIRSNVGLRAVIVDPILEQTVMLPVKQMEALIRGGDSRLLLLATGFGDFVPMLPDLVADTEEERHRSRLHALGARK